MSKGDMPDDTVHTNQSVPYEWRAVDCGGETLVVHDVPEGIVDCYRVADTTRNPRVFLQHDAVLWEGMVVEPVYDDTTRCVRLQHVYAGTKERVGVTEWVEKPVVLLERCRTVDLATVLDIGE